MAVSEQERAQARAAYEREAAAVAELEAAAVAARAVAQGAEPGDIVEAVAALKRLRAQVPPAQLAAHRLDIARLAVEQQFYTEEAARCREAVAPLAASLAEAKRAYERAQNAVLDARNRADRARVLGNDVRQALRDAQEQIALAAGA